MIGLSFDIWNSASGRFFIRERLYLHHKWTPLVRIRFRFLLTDREATARRRASEPPPPPEFCGLCKGSWEDGHVRACEKWVDPIERDMDRQRHKARLRPRREPATEGPLPPPYTS